MTDRTNSVGVICFRGDDVLLIKRGKPPMMGQWSIPGGRVEPGETLEDAAIREVKEETGVNIALGDLVLVFDTDMEGFSYKLHDFVARWVSGKPRAADDALHAEFISPQKLADIKIWHETRTIIETARDRV